MTVSDYMTYAHFLRPEIILAVGTMALMMVGAFSKGGGFRIVCYLSIALWAVAGLTVAQGGGMIFGSTMVNTGISYITKLLMTGGCIAALMISIKDLEGTILGRFEYPVLMSFSLLGMYLMVSAQDLIMLYVGLELSSLALYVLAAFNRNSPTSSEAGLKYFVLGAIASGILLFGSSLLYGFAGTTDFAGIEQAIANLVGSNGGVTPPVVAFGMAMVLAAIAFKISAVPFHVWTPDVYDGAPSSVTAFFAIVPQVAAIGLLIHLLALPFSWLANDWLPILTFMAVASMLIGSFAALVQTNLKRLIAYSSIGNIGYSLIGLVVFSQTSLMAVLLYAIIYVVTSAGMFSIILQLRKGGHAVEKIADLSGLSKTHPVMAYAMAAMMFSISGIPPLAGFFSKFAIFSSAVAAEYYVLAVVGVLTSVVGAWYYLNIIRVMFFENSTDTNVTLARAPLAVIVMGLSLAFLTLFVLMPQPLMDFIRDYGLTGFSIPKW